MEKKVTLVFPGQVELVPCDLSGREYTEADDMFVDDPSDLVGKPLNFKVKIISCNGLPNKYAVSVFTNSCLPVCGLLILS